MGAVRSANSCSPVDLLGCDAAQEYEFGAEAVTPGDLRRYRLSVVEDRAARDLVFAQRLRATACSRCAPREAVCCCWAQDGVRAHRGFLVEMQERLRPSEPGAIELPMCRGRRRHYLGLTIETVCRGLAELRELGIVAVERMRIRNSRPRRPDACRVDPTPLNRRRCQMTMIRKTMPRGAATAFACRSRSALSWPRGLLGLAQEQYVND